jgi:uncharacterized protein (TIGR00730 family)
VPLSTLCVFCGSSAGARPEYAAAARALGGLLVERGVGLVYGGGGTGLMAQVADAVLDAGGDVVGVMPRALVAREAAHRGLSDLRLVDTMHERKALMAELADGFLALPGGLGTLEELFEVWTWAQLGVHVKPCGLLNSAGYYSPLLAFLDRAVDERFVRTQYRAMLLVENEPAALLDRMAAYEAPAVTRWVSGGET